MKTSTLFFIISCSVLLRKRNISDKSRRENQNTFYFQWLIFIFWNRAIYELMWKTAVQPNRPQMAIWRMRIAYWITRAADTHSEHIILTSFPLQQMVTRKHRNFTLYVQCLSCLCSLALLTSNITSGFYCDGRRRGERWWEGGSIKLHGGSRKIYSIRNLFQQQICW